MEQYKIDQSRAIEQIARAQQMMAENVQEIAMSLNEISRFLSSIDHSIDGFAKYNLPTNFLWKGKNGKSQDSGNPE